MGDHRHRPDKDAADQRLHCRDLHPVFLVGNLLVEFRDIEGRGEFEQPFKLGIVERLLGLLAERIAIDKEQDAAEPLVLRAGDTSARRKSRLAGAGRHRDQHLAAALRQRSLDRLDCLTLIGPQPGVIERLLGKAMLIGVEVLCELLLDILWAEPFRQRRPHAVATRASQNQMPDLVASCLTNGRPFVANTNGTR